MSTLNIIRAWKDREYRLTLSEAERAALPEHPAGAIELPDGALDGAAGGFATGRCTGLFGCDSGTNNAYRC